MKIQNEKIVMALVVVAVVAVAGAAAWMWRPANNDNFPDGTFWICKNPQCKGEFGLTMKQLSDHHVQHYGQPIPCPKCGKSDTIAAERCPNCKKYYPMQRDVHACPFCKTQAT